MTELVEECKSKDKKRCEECEVLKLELAIMVGNCRQIEQMLVQCNADKMLIKLQCGKILHCLIGQEAKGARKKVEDEVKVK